MGVTEVDIPRHVREADNLIITPIGHAAEYSREVSQHGVGVVSVLNVDVAGISRLGTIPALAVWYLLIAVLCNLVKRPFVDIGCSETIA
ncbi:hypothetical protein D3C72_1828500 [compost metagenome]